MLKIDKSLLEVWEMKDLTYRAFIDSCIKSYTEYVEQSIKEVIEK